MNKFLAGLGVWVVMMVPSTKYYVCDLLHKCDDSAVTALAPIPRTNDLSFVVDDEPVLKGHEQFGFHTASATPVLTDDNEAFINKLSGYLKANPKSKVVISGAHLTSEKGADAGDFSNLGLLRADAIRDLFEAQGIDPNRLAISHHAANDLKKPISFQAINDDLVFTVDDEVMLKDNEQFLFDAENAEPRLTADNKAFLGKVEQFLKDNPKGNVTITAGYLESEKNVSVGIFDNIGIARANAIRELLKAKGIDEKRIITTYKMVNDLTAPATFTGKTKATPDDYDAAASNTFENINFREGINFDYNSAEFDASEAFNNYAGMLKKYFEENQGKSLTIIGHTDNRGSDNYNMNLGSRRAKSVKQYLSSKYEVPANLIKTQSKGESDPVADNDSEENMAKNRRVNFVIK